MDKTSSANGSDEQVKQDPEHIETLQQEPEDIETLIQHRKRAEASEQPTKVVKTGDDAAPLLAPRDSTLEAGKRFGSYRLIRLLGKGGFGQVWEAESIETGRRLALKVLTVAHDASSDAVQRFEQEGRLAASLNHPSCVYIFGAEEIEGYPVITMELMPGGTLQDVIHEKGPLPVKQAVDYILDMIDGLEAAQKAGAQNYAKAEFDAAKEQLSQAEYLVVVKKDYDAAIEALSIATEKSKIAEEIATNNKQKIKNEVANLIPESEKTLKNAKSVQKWAASYSDKVDPKVLDDLNKAIMNAEEKLGEAKQALFREDYLTAHWNATKIEESLNSNIKNCQDACKTAGATNLSLK